MALTANRDVHRFVDIELREYEVAASVHVYKGALLSKAASGYANPLVAGQEFVGIAYEEGDNSTGANGDVKVRAQTEGDFEMDLSGATIADIGKPVYASDDGTITLTATANSFVGYVQDFLSAGKVVVRLRGAIGATV